MPRTTPREADPIGTVVIAAFAKLQTIVRERTGTAFVWPDEGAFEQSLSEEQAAWRFNEQHEGFEPLWIDPTTASLVLRVHDALTLASVQERLRQRVGRDRGAFAQVVELCWSAARSPEG